VASLRTEALVGREDTLTPTPFVLDTEGRFALWRNHAHEMRIAGHIQQRRCRPSEALPAATEDELDELFGGSGNLAEQRQRDAVAAVLGRRLFVLTGGPGTGKTTTVLRMLLMLQSRSAEPLTIKVAAPTGKAAQRLVQSLREGKNRLRALGDKALPARWQSWLEHIPDGEALTVHRLLGFQPQRNAFTRNARNPVSADVLVIDEASMVDLGMLRALLDATPAHAGLIVVGDADQLTSVGAGSVLMDLVAALEAQQAPELVRLQHSFRAERHLVPINEAVNLGHAAALDAALIAAKDDARRVAVTDVSGLRSELRRWSRQLAELPIRPVLQAIRTSDDEATQQAVSAANTEAALSALRALATQQLLCALREDSFGAVAANAVIEAELRRRWSVADSGWYAGRAVMVTRNDYAAGLFNGDVGICLADETGRMQVWFETTLADGRASARSFAPGSLPTHDGAFAVTIHKSQGSEYTRAAVLLPPDPEHRILSRQLLYTGLSRAKVSVELWATPESVRAALEQPVKRIGGLASRLR
ncbi:MAG: exodeoxyribonuclease V subunit alpha, partial [Dokdonella sp.]